MTIPDKLRSLIGTNTPLNLSMRVTDVTTDGDGDGQGYVIHYIVGDTADIADASFLDDDDEPIERYRGAFGIPKEAADRPADTMAEVASVVAFGMVYPDPEDGG